ncbi:MAG: TolC family protein [Campylobacterota bacterium]|nr:TolC family protein [Campylobacterota bacterium]
MHIKIFQIFITIFLLVTNVNATSLKESIEQVVSANSEIIAEHFNKKAYRADIKLQEADYYPTVDFSTNIKKENKTEQMDSSSTTSDTDLYGWNANVKIEQLVYDGKKTSNNIKQYTHKYNTIKYKSNQRIEDLVFDTIKIYTTLVSYQELIAMDEFKIKVHEKYLQLAKEKEEISGERLDVYQVSSKIKTIIDHFLEQEVNQQKAFSQYIRLTSTKLNNNICRPIIDETTIPSTLEKTISIALKNSNKVLAQKEIIKEKIMTMNSQSSNFKPTIKLTAEVDWDSDIKLEDNGETKTYNIGLRSNWNLYNGGKDKITMQKNKIYVLEEKKILDTIEEEVIADTKGAYNTYYKLKKRIENIKSHILDNKAIVDINNRQLQDGTKIFLDLLNAESELFRTKILLINTEFLLFDEYYNILKNLDILSDTILKSNDQVCQKYIFNEPILKLQKQTEDELSNELGLE